MILYLAVLFFNNFGLDKIRGCKDEKNEIGVCYDFFFCILNLLICDGLFWNLGHAIIKLKR